MLMRTTVMSLLVLWVPCAGMAQNAAQEKTLEQLDQEVQRLRADIEVIAQKQAKMLEELEALKSMQQDANARQEQVLSSITQKDSSGTDVLRLSANMQKSEEFREEMQKAVHSSLRNTGEVLVRNKMATQQQIKINQNDYVIDAGETLKLEVPVGTLTSRLPGQELMTWSITPPEYKQTIDIVPKSQTTVTAYRPADAAAPVTTYYSPPVAEVPVYTAPVETYYVEPAPVYWPLWP